MSLYRDEAVVLRTYRLGEADRIVVLMTAGRGKVRAVAKGVRKTKSRFGSRLEPASHVRLLLWEGRELDVINQAEAVANHRRMRDDLERMSDALALVEAVDQVAQEGEGNRPLFQMLAGALRTLSDSEERPAMLVGAFYWKLLGLEGVAPMLDGCVRCGGEDLIAFDAVQGGALCRDHRRGQAVDTAVFDLLRDVEGGRLAAVLRQPPSPVTAMATDLATVAMENHLERRLRSVHLLASRSKPI